MSCVMVSLVVIKKMISIDNNTFVSGGAGVLSDSAAGNAGAANIALVLFTGIDHLARVSIASWSKQITW